MIGSHTLTRDDYRSWMTTATVTFSAIGQPEHITVPRDVIPYRKLVRLTNHHH